MVFVLIFDVGFHSRYKGLVVAKRSIASLPRESTMEIIIVNPFGALAFNLFDEVGDALGRVHTHKEVYMVGNTSNGVNEMMTVTASPSNIGMKVWHP